MAVSALFRVCVLVSALELLTVSIYGKKYYCVYYSADSAAVPVYWNIAILQSRPG